MPKICLFPGCNNKQFGGGYCSIFNHQKCRTDSQWLRRKAKEEEKKKEPKKAIKKFSSKYQSDVDKYNRDVGPWKLANPICCVPGCGQATTDCHHIISRGIHINNRKYWRPMCRRCHDRVKVDEQWALSLGLIETKTISRKHLYD